MRPDKALREPRIDDEEQLEGISKTLGGKPSTPPLNSVRHDTMKTTTVGLVCTELDPLDKDQIQHRLINLVCVKTGGCGPPLRKEEKKE